MKVIGLEEYGGPEVLKNFEIPTPHAGKNEVRIKVKAATVNPADVMLREGLLKGIYEGYATPYVPGMDVSGVIDEAGEGAGWEVGQEVVAVLDNIGSYGGYSEYAVVPAASVALKPKGLNFVGAASFLMNALTARTILNALNLSEGSTLAVTGGPGAMGGYVIRLASLEGIHVIADARDSDVELLKSFGAETILPRGDNLGERIRKIVPDGVDAVADGALLHEAITPAIRDNGQIAVLRGWPEEAGRGITVQRVNVRDNVHDSAAITRLAEMVDAGILSIRIAGIFPADKAHAAHAMIERSGIRGRIVLTF